MNRALDVLAARGDSTPCQRTPVPFVDVRQDDQQARKLCEGCPLLKWDVDGSRQNICLTLGRSEGMHADGMVYGGVVIHHEAQPRQFRHRPPVVREPVSQYS